MFKYLTVFLLGAVVGGVGGIQYSTHHPDEAANISNKADVKELQIELAGSKGAKAALDKFADRPNADQATKDERDKLAKKIDDLQTQLDNKK